MALCILGTCMSVSLRARLFVIKFILFQFEIRLASTCIGKYLPGKIQKRFSAQNNAKSEETYA